MVVAIIAILASIVILALNPNKQLGDSRNAQRRADVNTILSAVYQYEIDNNGTVPATIPSGTDCTDGTHEICQTNGSCIGLIDISQYLVGTSSKYLVSMPIDPSSDSLTGTGYQIYKNNDTKRITVCAPKTENIEIISVSR